MQMKSLNDDLRLSIYEDKDATKLCKLENGEGGIGNLITAPHGSVGLHIQTNRKQLLAHIHVLDSEGLPIESLSRDIELAHGPGKFVLIDLPNGKGHTERGAIRIPFEATSQDGKNSYGELGFVYHKG